MRTLFCAYALLLCLTASAMAAPNIVVVLTDDQEDTGSMAYMPKVQALAEQGVTFKNSFVNFSLCSPSRASKPRAPLKRACGSRKRFRICASSCSTLRCRA